MSKRCPSGNASRMPCQAKAHAIMHSVTVDAVAATAAAIAATLRCTISRTHHSDQRWHWQFSSAFLPFAIFYLLFAISIFRVRLVVCTTVGSGDTPTHRHKNGLVFRVYSLLGKSFSCV